MEDTVYMPIIVNPRYIQKLYIHKLYTACTHLDIPIYLLALNLNVLLVVVYIDA